MTVQKSNGTTENPFKRHYTKYCTLKFDNFISPGTPSNLFVNETGFFVSKVNDKKRKKLKILTS